MLYRIRLNILYFYPLWIAIAQVFLTHNMANVIWKELPSVLPVWADEHMVIVFSFLEDYA